MARKKTIPTTKKRLSNSWQLMVQTIRTLRAQWQPLGLITIIYTLLSLVFVRGLAAGINVHDLKSQFGANSGELVTNLGVFTYLLGNGTSNTDGGAVYQFFIVVVTSLALIWSLRQINHHTKFKVRDAYYHGMYPLVPFILVLVICAIQLIPFIIGSAIYGLVVNNGIAVHLIEQLGWGALFLGLTVWSLYMLTASIISLCVVSLPNMTPLRAHRTARKLVHKRRWRLLGRMVALAVLLLVITVVIVVPVIAVAPLLAQWVLFILSMCGLTIAHIYVYTMYTELLDD